MPFPREQLLLTYNCNFVAWATDVSVAIVGKWFGRNRRSDRTPLLIKVTVESLTDTNQELRLIVSAAVTS